MKFLKMHGIGNDFIVTHGYSDQQILRIRDDVVRLCERRKGVGADGIIFILPPKDPTVADFRMRIFNADGSEPEMCGSGIRCFACYIAERQLSPKTSLAVETGAGLVQTIRKDDLVTVDMGNPVLEANLIPTAQQFGRVIDQPLGLEDETVQITAVSMGNPHAVIFCNRLTDEFVARVAPKIQANPFFPKSVNVEFVQVLSRTELRMRVYERGCGETLACGTGACASVVAAILNKKVDNEVAVHLPGGDLRVSWDGDCRHSVLQTGPAQIVYEGSLADIL